MLEIGKARVLYGRNEKGGLRNWSAGGPRVIDIYASAICVNAESNIAVTGATFAILHMEERAHFVNDAHVTFSVQLDQMLLSLNLVLQGVITSKMVYTLYHFKSLT